MIVTINLNEKDIKKTEVIDALNVFLTAVKEQRCADDCKCEQAETPAPIVETPVAPTPVVPTAPVVPTPAQQYTLEMLANAGATLVNAGKMAEVTQILAKYGVEALTALNPSLYEAVAMDLRSLGAQI